VFDECFRDCVCYGTQCWPLLAWVRHGSFRPRGSRLMKYLPSTWCVSGFHIHGFNIICVRFRETRGSNSVLRGVQSFHSHLALEVKSAWSNRSLNRVPSWRVTVLNFNGTRAWYLRWQPARPHVTAGDGRNLLQLSDMLMHDEQVIKKPVWSSCQQIADTVRLVIRRRVDCFCTCCR